MRSWSSFLSARTISNVAIWTFLSLIYLLEGLLTIFMLQYMI